MRHGRVEHPARGPAKAAYDHARERHGVRPGPHNMSKENSHKSKEEALIACHSQHEVASPIRSCDKLHPSTHDCAIMCATQELMVCFTSGFKMFDRNGICSKESNAFWDCYRKERGTIGFNLPSSMTTFFSLGDSKDKKYEK